MIRVLTLPDWREGNPYQESLRQALLTQGVALEFPQAYRRGLPLARMDLGQAELVHLHWPEAYFREDSTLLSLARRLRFPFDLALLKRRLPVVYTAHNLFPHGLGGRFGIQRNTRAMLRGARAVIAHSSSAAAQLRDFDPACAPVHVIPHGDPADGFPTLPDRDAARRELGISSGEHMVLMFGRVEPYKGIEEAIATWRETSPSMRLWIAGTPRTPEYQMELVQRAGDQDRIKLELAWLSAPALATRLAACDAVLFNYRHIFTSGAGALARSLGRKILLPRRLQAIELGAEPEGVWRFDALSTDGLEVLKSAVANEPPHSATTAAWRRETAWSRVGEQTAAVYRAIN